jgi:indole-3-glycerol phosphate synthase
MTILERIIQDVRKEVRLRASVRPIERLQAHRAKRLSLIEAIEKARGVPVIAEIKLASPSAGNIREGADALEVARAMLRGGAVSLSVLTEPKHFKGDLELLRKVRKAAKVPLLQKDFIVEEYQVLEAAELGADVVLLIAKVLGRDLGKFMRLVEDLGMESLVEVTSREEVELVVSAGANLVGINNRDLGTLRVDLGRTVELAPLVPDSATLVSESGIETEEDVRRMLDAGADAILVGTALMRAGDIEQKVRELVSAR